MAHSQPGVNSISGLPSIHLQARVQGTCFIQSCDTRACGHSKRAYCDSKGDVARISLLSAEPRLLPATVRKLNIDAFSKHRPHKAAILIFHPEPACLATQLNCELLRSGGYNTRITFLTRSNMVSVMRHFGRLS